ncbi:peptide/nickel transport system substrate-binding protein [Arcanobacterium pluranimalium]|uniref:ABC transporter substrate-binding protein n=1 Tax=Arcanobacterium pluranimalium TaxID=108028 RepID=UPI00195AFB70|nr:ABC transporter substrate-binding protein [Arcanobacterium pluranimalium]MBM7825868.1 peptide/nickel transport system substrate-binding protein [Arcanobacterium pluranimalium]
MRLSKRLVKASAIVGAAALALSACGGGSSDAKKAPADSGKPSGQINLGVAYETTNYHPSTTSSALAMGTNWHVVEGLYEFDMADYKVYPALAKGDPKKVSDTEYEITLRDGAKFSDGTPVKAEDFVSSYGRTTAEKSIYKQFFTFVDSVKAKDEKTVVIKLKFPFGTLKERLVDVKVVPTKMSDADLTAKPVGSGPFKYESISNTQIVAVPNEHYNGSMPARVEKMQWSVLKDDSARLAAAVGGTIDIMEAVPAPSADKLKAAGWKVEEVQGYNNPFLMFNTKKAPFNDPKVRQAFHYAINTEKLIDSAMSGKASPAQSFLPETNAAFKKAKVQYKYDQAKAKELLAAAGVNHLDMTLVTTDHPWIANLAPQIKSDLEAVGIKVNIKSQASADVYANYADNPNSNYDAIVAPGDPSVFGVDPGIIINWWYGDNVWTKQRGAWQTSAPEKFAALQKLAAEASQLSGDAAKEKWGEVQDMISEEVPLYPLFHRVMITAYNPKKLVDVKPIGTTGLEVVGVSAAK